MREVYEATLEMIMSVLKSELGKTDKIVRSYAQDNGCVALCRLYNPEPYAPHVNLLCSAFTEEADTKKQMTVRVGVYVSGEIEKGTRIEVDLGDPQLAQKLRKHVINMVNLYSRKPTKKSEHS